MYKNTAFLTIGPKSNDLPVKCRGLLIGCAVPSAGVAGVGSKLNPSAMGFVYLHAAHATASAIS
jgi:hypothetical protein